MTHVMPHRRQSGCRHSCKRESKESYDSLDSDSPSLRARVRNDVERLSQKNIKRRRAST